VRLSFDTTTAAAAVKKADAVFIAVGTPLAPPGRPCRPSPYVYAAAEEIADLLDGFT